MINSSVADIDDFIRAQKMKLNRDRGSGISSPINQFYGNQPPSVVYYIFIQNIKLNQILFV